MRQHGIQTFVARDAADLDTALRESRAGFEVSRVPAAAAAGWAVIDGALQHASRGFFSVTGVIDERTGQDYALLYQPQAAITGLLSARIDGEICYLLQARAEPGCLGEAQFGPTVQATPANFMRLHGGAPTPYIEAFIAYPPHATLIDDTTQLDLGERYLFKCKRSILIELAAPAPPQPSFVWASSSAIREAVGKSAFLNVDLRSILSIAPWSSDGDGLTPRSDSVRRSLASPVRGDAVGALLARLQSAQHSPPRLAPLRSLKNWLETEWGWSEVAPRQGFAVDFFQVKAAFREKDAWVQPLVNSATPGRVALACRDNGGGLEFLVRVVPEIGLATSAAIAPSYVRYPGVAEEPPAWLEGRPAWSATTESDEGGRFYRDASTYEVVRIDDAGDIIDADDGAWVTLPELKLLLRLSNVCTIQLRGVVSQLLGVI